MFVVFDGAAALYLGNAALFLAEISIGNPSHTRSFLPIIPPSLTEYPGIIRKILLLAKTPRGSHFLLESGRRQKIVVRGLLALDNFQVPSTGRAC